MQLQFIRSQQRLYTMDDRGLIIMIAAALLYLATMSLDNHENRCRTANTGAKQRSGISVHPMALFISQRTIAGRVIYTAAAAGLPILMLHIKAGYLPLAVYACKMPMESKCLIGSLRTETIYC